MRRLVLLAVLAGLAVVLAGCGYNGVASPTPETVIGTLPKAPTVPTVPADKLQSSASAAAGKKVFTSIGCSGCHTLAAAGATGTVGPNLDQLAPDFKHVAAQVTNGGATMPSFKGRLSSQQIADVAAFVSQSAGKS